MDLYTLLKECNISYNKTGVFNHIVGTVQDNSLKVGANDIFVAIKGENNDGHRYIADAVTRGAKTVIYEDSYYSYQNFGNVNMIKIHDTKKAVAVLAHYFYDEPSRKVHLTGVTGTNGKTTVTTLIYNILRLTGEHCTLIGTAGIRLDDEKRETVNTTPSALLLNRLLEDSFKAGIKNVMMEVSSHALKQERVSQLDFETVIYTNFSHDHLDYHKTLDDYFYSKGRLFCGLGNNYNDKTAILNGDDHYAKQFISLTNVRYYTYGINEDNDIRARNIVCDINKISFDLFCFNQYIGHLKDVSLFGFFNVYNLLAVLSYFYLKGYNMDLILEKASLLRSVTGRMERVENEAGLNVFVDYAHTPDSVYRILYESRMISRRSIIAVIGCGGNRDVLKRPIIGKIATNLADYVIFTTDNPRFESPENILNDIVKGACNNNYIVIENRSKAIKYAVDIAGKTDVILILGKGHEDYQLIGDQKRPFSDYEEVVKYIKMRFDENNEKGVT